MTAHIYDTENLTANAKRAVQATLDRVRAERNQAEAYAEYERCLAFEKFARSALTGDEEHAYGVAASHAVAQEGLEGRPL